MRIIFDSATVAEPRWFPIFDVILMLVEDERHNLAPENIEQLLESAWMRSRTKTDRDLVRLSALKKSTDAKSDATSVTINDRSPRGGVTNFALFDTALHPLDAITFLSLPFQVIVENEWYDGGFLLWMAKALGFERFLIAHRQRRFAFRHAGGKDSLARSAEIVSSGVWPRWDRKYVQARRLWACVILDNDARFPGDDPNATIRAEVEPHVAFLRQLRRRSIESYLPRQAMLSVDATVPFRAKVDALFRLADEQRTHFHMKSGFRFERNLTPSKADYMASTAVRPEEKLLFGPIAGADWGHIREGFGRKLASCYVEPHLRPNLNDNMAIDPTDRTEMMAILSEIYKRI